MPVPQEKRRRLIYEMEYIYTQGCMKNLRQAPSFSVAEDNPLSLYHKITLERSPPVDRANTLLLQLEQSLWKFYRGDME
jgi:hypothetical protein